MSVTFAKHNGFTERKVRRRNCVRNGKHVLKEVGNCVRNGKHAVKEARLKTSNNSGDRIVGQANVESSTPRASSKSISSDSRSRPRRKRRRRRRKGRKSQEKGGSLTNELKFQVQLKPGRRKRKGKRKIHVKKNVMCLDSSGSASSLPLSSNSSGSHQTSPQSSNGFSHVSSTEDEKLPWANLEVPMDLSLVNLEISGHGVDFEMQAQESHLRWLANLEKAREKDVCSDNTSE